MDRRSEPEAEDLPKGESSTLEGTSPDATYYSRTRCRGSAVVAGLLWRAEVGHARPISFARQFQQTRDLLASPQIT